MRTCTFDSNLMRSDRVSNYFKPETTYLICHLSMDNGCLGNDKLLQRNHENHILPTNIAYTSQHKVQETEW